MSPCNSNHADKIINHPDEEKTASRHASSAVHHTAQGVCKNVVHEDLSISAQVVIDPIVDIGPITTHCVSRPEIIPGDGKCTPSGRCSFVVRQRICVEVPITFGAATTADPLGFACHGADAGPCDCSR